MPGRKTFAVAVVVGAVAAGGGAALGSTHGGSAPAPAKAPAHSRAPAAVERHHADGHCPNAGRAVSSADL